MVSPLVWSNFFGQNVDLTSGLHCTVIHDAGVSESDFREKFAPAVADPAIMTVLTSMMGQ